MGKFIDGAGVVIEPPDEELVFDVLDFEGVDYVSIPAAALSSLNEQVTIALWQYGDEAIQPQNNNIIQAKDSSSYRVFNVCLPWGSGDIIWDCGATGTTASDTDRISKTASPAEYEGRWNHWAFTKNTTPGQGWMRIYLNGTQVRARPDKIVHLDNITDFSIGEHIVNGWNYTGLIDDFRI